MRVLTQFFILLFLVSSAALAQPLKYPTTKKVEFSETLFGYQISDPYRWLEANSSETQAWVAQQNIFAHQILSQSPHRERIKNRIREFQKMSIRGVPMEYGNRVFSTFKGPGSSRLKYIFREKNSTKESVCFDEASLGKSDSLGAYGITRDGRFFIYTVEAGSGDEATLYVRDIDTGKNLPEQLRGLKYSEFASTDGRGLYYVYYPTTPGLSELGRSEQVELRYHLFGTNQNKDKSIYAANGTSMYFSLETHGDWILFKATGQDRDRLTNYYLKKGSDPLEDFRPLSFPNLFQMEVAGGYIYIRTNDIAPRFRIVRTPESKIFDSPVWEQVIEEPDSLSLSQFSAWGSKLFLRYTYDGETRIEVSNLDGQNRRRLNLPAGIASTPRAALGSKTGYLTVQSMLKNSDIYQIDAEKLEPVLYRKIQIPFASERFEQKHLEYPSRDGTSISMDIAFPKNIQKDKNLPVLLYAYGGFDSPANATFDEKILTWLEAGGAYAILHVRGGNEKGVAWWVAAAQNKKQKTYDDVIAGAEFLIREGYTRPAKLALMGISNGGLTTAAVITQRPDLFAAAVSEVPLTDMIRYPLFGAAARGWINEYGDPSVASDFNYLLSYSPYHHVVPMAAYPAVLFVSAAGDDRVDPMHARKMTARLQELSGSKNPILLRTEIEAGHGGSADDEATLDTIADKFGFLLDQLQAPVP